MPIAFYVVILVVVLAVSLVLAIRAARQKKPETTSFDNVVLAIKVPKENEKDARSAEQMFASLHGLLKQTPEVQEHLSFEIRSSADGINFYAVVPKDFRTFIESQIYAQYPEAEIREAEDYAAKIDFENQLVDGAYLKLEREQIFPIRTYQDFEVDPLASITGAISDLAPGEEVWLQILFRPIADVWQEEGYTYIERIREGASPAGISPVEIFNEITKEIGEFAAHFAKSIFAPAPGPAAAKAAGGFPSARLSAGQEVELKAIEEKLTRMGFETAIRVLTVGGSKESAADRLRSTLASFRQFATANLNSFTKVELSDSERGLFPNLYQQRAFSQDQSYVLNTTELASVFHLPSVSVETPAIAWTASRKSEPPLSLPTTDCVYFARTNFRDQLVNFGIKGDDRRRHIYLVGKTGTGKTTLFKNMIIQDMEEGRGVGVLDPHGDLIEELLDYVPAERVQDVVILDPSDRERPVSLNLLESPDPSQNNLMASGLVSAIKKHFEYSWGPRLEYLLNNAILTLIEVPNTTLLGITRLLQDKNYQKYIVYKIKDPVLKDFWENEFKQMMGNVAFHTEAIQPIQNKIGRFLATSTIRNILGQAKSSIRLDEIMDEGKILFVNLSKGKIGEDNANLLGSLIISRLNFMAMRRVGVPEDQRRDFYLYADEFQNFASGSFASILSEARKYHLCLNLTHQYTAQLPEEMQDAIFGNVGTTISFALGAPDAKVLAPEFAPVFEENDLITLDKFHIYVKLMIDGMTSTPFSAVTLPPPEEADQTSNKERVIKLSRETYGRSAGEVEGRIRRWTEKQFDLGTAKADEARERRKDGETVREASTHSVTDTSAPARDASSARSQGPAVAGQEKTGSLEGEIRVNESRM